MLGPYPTADEAWRAGIERFGKPGFLLKRLVREERPIVVSPLRFHGTVGA